MGSRGVVPMGARLAVLALFIRPIALAVALLFGAVLARRMHTNLPRP